MNIQELISQAGKHLRDEFENIKNSNPHYAERGAEAEKILEDFLNHHLPKRFAAGSGLVIDHQSNISSQADVIIYDALNSPIYRKGQRVLILPSDNVAATVEVKSSLCKEELEDAAKKIASVKKLAKTPITNTDQPVTFSSLITTKTLGVVFAYDSKTSLETLAENIREINQTLPSDQWIDTVVVLDKGVIGYTIQNPFEQEFPGWFGGASSQEFPILPIYIHLIKEDLGELTLNRFFVNLMAHLIFYRKRSSVVFESVMGKQNFQCMTLQGYQYNLKRELIPVEKTHQEGNLLPSMIKFNLYSAKDGMFVGQIAWIPWQDGAALSYSGRFGPPHLFFRPYFKEIKSDGLIIPGMENNNLWLSSVIPLSKEKFIEISEKIKGEVVAKHYVGDEDIKDFPKTLDEYNTLISEKDKK
ncbi:MAG: hypothetical protein ISS47_07530 [Candidatus Omnitrophica bacterium]|nr:hypothetical protein [Candidatus Omnitrophota bacterium]